MPTVTVQYGMEPHPPPFSADHPQYVFIGFSPGVRWNQNRPDSITDGALFWDTLAAVTGRRADPSGARRLGLAFILSYLNGPPEKIEETARRLLTLSEKYDVPVQFTLEGRDWWGHRPDLWNWWDPTKPGYDPKNRENVEWTGWGPEHAVKIAWRNWGHQIRVLPPPNLLAPRFRAADGAGLLRLARLIKAWADHLPTGRRYLFPGVRAGSEVSIGVNAYHYPGGNTYQERWPTDPSHDPTTGLDKKKDFAGGLPPLGYAALASEGRKRPGEPITLVDQERLTADYLRFIASVCRKAGFRPDEIFVHAGGQYAPWEKHYTHGIALNRDSIPGWSLYYRDPAASGDLDTVMERAGRQEWFAGEWLTHSPTPEGWAAALRRTLDYRRCRALSVYNWEHLRDKPHAWEGLRRVLSEPPSMG